jgi:tRNA(fMet)-specific endonuclease VapC
VKYILDTNTLSFLMKGDPDVAGELLSKPRTDVLVPQTVVAEIEYGLSRMSRSKKLDRLRQRFDSFMSELPRADWSDEVSRTFGQTKAALERKGMRLEDFDVAVAAHALALGATLVTDNTEHMKRIRGLDLENWHSQVQ